MSTTTTATTTSSSPSAALTALLVLLQHDPSLLTTRELGRLSICSKDISATCEEDAGVWKALFEKCAKSGKNYLSTSTNGRTLMTWNGEDGLLECFSDPSAQVLARVGYKRAAGCLLGKSCVQCGKMEGRANPLTLHRICKDCSRSTPEQFLTSKSRAKTAFLLTEKDLNALPSAAFSSVNPISQKPFTNVVYLLSDIKSAAFAKYNGSDGLANEIEARESKAMARYNRSQSTGKPQKKRPKISRMSRRPGDDNNLKSHVFFAAGGASCLPVGCAIYNIYNWEKPANGFKGMGFSVSCRYDGCDCMGNNHDIAAHERLEHDNNRVILPHDPPRKICPIDQVPGGSESLVRWFSTAECFYKRVEGEYDEEEDTYTNSNYCIIRGDGGVTFEVMRWEEVSLCTWGELSVYGQTGSCRVPVKLLELGIGERSGTWTAASHDKLLDFMPAVGCDSTAAGASPAQLLVMVLSRAMSLRDAQEDVRSNGNFWRHFWRQNPPYVGSGLIGAMYHILKQPRER